MFDAGNAEPVHRPARAAHRAMCDAMRAARLAAECGLTVIAAHAIDGRPKIVVAARRDAIHRAGQVEVDGITIEWWS